MITTTHTDRVSAILTAAADLISAPDAWAQDADATTAEGRPVLWSDPDADAYCATSACILGTLAAAEIEPTPEMAIEGFGDAQHSDVDEAVRALADHWEPLVAARKHQIGIELASPEVTYPWAVAERVNDQIAVRAIDVAACMRAVADDPAADHADCAPWAARPPRRYG